MCSTLLHRVNKAIIIFNINARCSLVHMPDYTRYIIYIVCIVCTIYEQLQQLSHLSFVLCIYNTMISYAHTLDRGRVLYRILFDKCLALVVCVGSVSVVVQRQRRPSECPPRCCLLQPLSCVVLSCQLLYELCTFNICTPGMLGRTVCLPKAGKANNSTQGLFCIVVCFLKFSSIQNEINA